MLEGGITPSQLDHEKYLSMLKVLKAKPRDKRPMAAGEAHKKLAKMLGA